MVNFEKKYRQNLIKYTLKRTKLHRLKKFSRRSMPPNPPSNAHGFAMRSMSLRDMQTSKSEKKILGPPPPKSWGRPCTTSYKYIEVRKVHVHQSRKR